MFTAALSAIVKTWRDFPSSRVAKILVSTAESTGSTPGWGTRFCDSACHPVQPKGKKRKNDSSSKAYFRQVKCYARQVLINPSLSPQCVQLLSCVQLFMIPCTVAHPRNFPGKNTGVSYHFLLQGIFPRLLCLLHWKVHSLPLSHLGSPQYLGLTLSTQIVIVTHRNQATSTNN